MPKKTLESGNAERSDRDIAVAPSRLRWWLSRAALAATGAALLATGAPPEFYYSFSKTVAAPGAELTAAAQSARFLITARATGFAPNGKPTTDQPSATLAGAVTEDGANSFVKVRVTNFDDPFTDELSVLRDFSVPRLLTFSGDCATLSGAPCQTRLLVEFERSDSGSQGGTVRVNWSLELESRTKKSSPNEGPLDLPWDVEVSPQ
jgi:hypothetical protein